MANGNTIRDTKSTFRRLRNRLTDALLELDSIEKAMEDLAQEPVKPKRSKDKFQQQLAANAEAGGWRKPKILR